LRTLAQTWQPLADERRIDLEIFVLYKLLLVQVCKGILSGPEVQESTINKVFAAFYGALEPALGKDLESTLYVTEYIQSRIGADPKRLSALEDLWVTRSNRYNEPFVLDREEYFENRPSHLPWKRMIGRFMQNFRETSDPLHDVVRDTPGAFTACLEVTRTFGEYYEKVGNIIISLLAKARE